TPPERRNALAQLHLASESRPGRCWCGGDFRLIPVVGDWSLVRRGGSACSDELLGLTAGPEVVGLEGLELLSRGLDGGGRGLGALGRVTGQRLYAVVRDPLRPGEPDELPLLVPRTAVSRPCQVWILPPERLS